MDHEISFTQVFQNLFGLWLNILKWVSIVIICFFVPV